MEDTKIPNVKKDNTENSIIKPYFKEPESVKKIEEEVGVNKDKENKTKIAETNNEPVIKKTKVEKSVDNNIFKNNGYVLTPQKVSSLLKGKTFKEAVNIGKELDTIKDVSEMLDSFINNATKPDINPSDFIRQVYSLYNTMLNILNTRDTHLFSVKMRYLVNTICIARKEGLIDELTFLKYDYEWTWGDKDYNRYSKLITVIFVACERGIKNVRRIINLDRLSDIFNEPAVNNLRIFF